MRTHCTCGKVTAIIKSGSHIRKGSVIVCKECMARFLTADKTARMARDQVQTDPTLNNLMNIFNMKGKP